MFSNKILVRFLKSTRPISAFQIHSTASIMSAKIALVLSGCGVYDGSEIHETSACIVHLSREQANVTMFAPDIPQMHVIDHTKGSEMEPSRNVMVESARIARGNIRPLSELNSNDFDGVIFPGGFGAAKNLCTWAVENTNCKVNSDVERVIKSFHKDSKVLGFSCIAPVLAAKCIPGVELTVGHTLEENGKWPYAGTAGAMEQCGAKHVVRDVDEIHIDEKNKVVTTPAYMCNASAHEIFDGMGELVKAVIKTAKE